MSDKTTTCHAHIKDDILTISNSLVERKWIIKNGLLYAASFKDLISNREWLSKTSITPSPFPPIEKAPDEERRVTIHTQTKRPSSVSVEALEAIVTATGKTLTLVYRFIIFPNVPGINIQLSANGPAFTIDASTNVEKVQAMPTGDEKTLTNQNASLPPIDGLEHLNLTPQHLRLTQITFKDCTDIYNELAQENHWLLQPNESQIPLTGNLFFVEDTLSANGLIFLKEAPLPHARPIKTWADFRVHGKANFSSAIKNPEFDSKHPRWPLAYQMGFFGHGMGNASNEGYRWVVLAYQGGRSGRTRTLHNYQRQWRPYEPGRDGLLLSNTWGDRSMNSRINETFIIKEAKAGAKMGVDIMQIDDGWQRGLEKSTNTGGTDLWQGIWKATDKFWLPHPTRLPKGLNPIAKTCEKLGIQMGIWYVVDPQDSYANWRLDLARLMELHREQGVNFFKFDGVILSSKESEKNFNQLIAELLSQSNNKITIDLDVTAGVRQGYFGSLINGTLFVENRYTDWHGYWPHQTLRNLWTLSQYIDPVRLRFEFLNNSRNLSFYTNDPLAPVNYQGDYLFATVMFASSLAWFEVQNYPEVAFKQVGKLVKIWKQHREAIARGSIFPIGSQPDGTSWTGFCSRSADNKSSYVLIFRELNNVAEHTFELPIQPTEKLNIKKLAGSGSAKLRKNTLFVKIPKQLSYFFAKIN